MWELKLCIRMGFKKEWERIAFSLNITNTMTGGFEPSLLSVETRAFQYIRRARTWCNTNPRPILTLVFKTLVIKRHQ